MSTFIPEVIGGGGGGILTIDTVTNITSSGGNFNYVDITGPGVLQLDYIKVWHTYSGNIVGLYVDYNVYIDNDNVTIVSDTVTSNIGADTNVNKFFNFANPNAVDPNSDSTYLKHSYTFCGGIFPFNEKCRIAIRARSNNEYATPSTQGRLYYKVWKYV